MLDKAVVRWADGSYDINRTCVMCHAPKCFMPVYTERYKVNGMEQWEVDLTSEEAELSGLTVPAQATFNGSRTDATDTLMSQEDYAPEELANDD